MTDKNKKSDENRQPREAQTRDKQEVRKPWAPRLLWMHLIPQKVTFIVG